MNITRKITVFDHQMNQYGIRISYCIDDVKKHFVTGAEDLDEILEEWDLSLEEGLSQFDAIQIVADHERKLEARRKSGEILDPLFDFFKALNPTK